MLAVLVTAALATATAVQAPAVTQDPAREALRKELSTELGGAADFQLVETGPLFVLTQVHDKRFVQELELRVRLVQEAIERDFPPELEEGQDPPAPVVVRLYRDLRTYVAVGGPEGSSNFVDDEGKRFLVYDQPQDGRHELWRALAGLQFKAHWKRTIGLPWPHGWMLHGHEDYYAGFELHAGKLVRRPNAPRLQTIRGMLRRGDLVPFDDFLRWRGREYYGVNGMTDVGETYAEGWSFVWFLRGLPELRHKPEGWQPSWELIVDRYVAGMRTTHEKGVAVDAALEGVDLLALQAAWMDSVD